MNISDKSRAWLLCQAKNTGLTTDQILDQLIEDRSSEEWSVNADGNVVAMQILAPAPLGWVDRSTKRWERLLPRIQEKFSPDGECWAWTGAINNRGYPMMRRGGRTCSVRREVWCALHGDTMSNVYTTCGRKDCINPNHLKTRESHPGLLGKAFPGSKGER